MPTPTHDMLGLATVIGIGTSAITGVSTFVPDKVSMERDAEEKIGKNNLGNTNRVAYFDHKKMLSITFTPTGATKSAAKAVLASTPKPGTVVTITDADDSEVAGVWILKKAKKNKSNSDEATMDLDLWQPEDSSVASTVIS